MIQRKQTLFLLLAVIASVVMFFFPLAHFIGEKDSIVLYVQKVYSLVPDHQLSYGLTFLLSLLIPNIFVILFSLIAVFLYKNRKLQMRIIQLNVFVEVLFIALFFFYDVNVLQTAAGSAPDYNIGAMMSPIAMVFLVLAYYGVRSDERLVRSADRLR